MKKLMTRLITGLILLFIVGFTAFKGEVSLFLLLIFLNIVGSYEIHGVLEKLDVDYPLSLHMGYGIINVFLMYLDVRLALAFFLVFFIFIFGLSTLTEKISIDSAMAMIFAIIYINIFFSLFLSFESVLYFAFVYSAAWGTDTSAYIVGSLFGKRKLNERLSPKKTVEGAIGGVVGSVLIGFILFKFLGSETFLPWLVPLALGSVISQVGDLSASYLKRMAGVKDYGKFLAGHGGVLDRFDSVLFVIPYTYLLMILRMVII